MTITSIGTSAPNIASSTTIVLTTTASVAVGDFIIVVVGAHRSTTLTQVVDTGSGGSNTYALDKNTASTVNAQLMISSAQATKALASGQTITATYNAAQTDRMIAAFKVTGIVTSSAFDKAVTANQAASLGATLAWSSGSSGTLAQADELIIGASIDNASVGVTSTAGGSFTELVDIQNNDAVSMTVEWLESSATTAQTATGTWTAANHVTSSLVAAYKVVVGPNTPDTVTVTESIGVILVPLVNLSDSITVTESLSATVLTPPTTVSKSESITVTESVNVTLTFNAQVMPDIQMTNSPVVS